MRFQLGSWWWSSHQPQTKRPSQYSWKPGKNFDVVDIGLIKSCSNFDIIGAGRDVRWFKKFWYDPFKTIPLGAPICSNRPIYSLYVSLDPWPPGTGCRSCMSTKIGAGITNCLIWVCSFSSCPSECACYPPTILRQRSHHGPERLYNLWNL